jgi:hypothetical protein
MGAPALWVEWHELDGVHHLVSLSGQPNPEAEDTVECASMDDALRLVKRWNALLALTNEKSV